MNTKPVLQNKLYELNPIFDEIVNLYNSNKLPSKILFSGSKGIGKSTLAYHLINYIFSINETSTYDINLKEINIQNNSFKLIKNGSHPNFHLIDLIDDKKNIEIAQIRSMINYANKSSFNNRPRFILIDNVENLNINSSPISPLIMLRNTSLLSSKFKFFPFKISFINSLAFSII